MPGMMYCIQPALLAGIMMSAQKVFKKLLRAARLLIVSPGLRAFPNRNKLLSTKRKRTWMWNVFSGVFNSAPSVHGHTRLLHVLWHVYLIHVCSFLCACGPGYQALPPSAMWVSNLLHWSSSRKHMEHSWGSCAFNVAPDPQQNNSGVFTRPSLPLSF